MWDYLLPWAKVKCRGGHLGDLRAQNSQSKATFSGRGGLLVVLAKRTVRAAPTTPLCESSKACQEGCPGLPCPLSPERAVLLHSVIPWLMWSSPVFCLATLHLNENKAAEMCTADGRNYLGHLTSEICFPLFLLSIPFPQITPSLGKLIDSLCKTALSCACASNPVVV